MELSAAQRFLQYAVFQRDNLYLEVKLKEAEAAAWASAAATMSAFIDQEEKKAK